MNRFLKIQSIILVFCICIMTFTSCDNSKPNGGSGIKIFNAKPNPNEVKLDPIKNPNEGDNAQMESVAKITDKKLIIKNKDPKYGGSQFIGKLFTEGLGRAPEPEEYIYYSNKMMEKTCTVKTLAELSYEFFSSSKYLSLDLNLKAEAMTLYRAILNRDPSLEEVEAYMLKRADRAPADIAKELVNTEELKDLLEDIIEGPYYFSGNNPELSTTDKIITSAEIYTMLQENDVVELEEGATIAWTHTIILESGKTLRTKGNPKHYTKMARIIKTVDSAKNMLILKEGSVLENVWVDGHVKEFPKAKFSSLVLLSEDNIKVLNCRISNSVGTCLSGKDFTSNHYVANNFITNYASNHYFAWGDGITWAAKDSIVENNQIVDATDVAIVVFRYADYNEKQNTIVRNNTLINLGNSGYAALNTDAWEDSPSTPVHSFEGCTFENNRIWTSLKAHQHIALSVASHAWFAKGGQEGKGASFINNYTPEGLSVTTGAAIAVDGMYDATIRGNKLNINLIENKLNNFGDMSEEGKNLAPRLYSVNPKTASGEFQIGFEDGVTFVEDTPFITTADSYEPFKFLHINEALLYDWYVPEK